MARMSRATLKHDNWLTTSQAASILGIGVDSVRRYCANFRDGGTPRIRGTLVGKSWMIHAKDIQEYQQNRQGVGRPKKS